MACLIDAGNLSARVLKAKYFPDTEFLKAYLGSCPPKVWHSIPDGRDAMKQGIKRAGTGEDTNPCNEKWLPRKGALRPVTCLAADPPMRVSEFINSAMATWDVEKLGQFFIPMDIEIIRSIHLSTRHQVHCWAWHYDLKGLFMIHSAYKMLVSTKESREAWLEGTASMSDRRNEES